MKTLEMIVKDIKNLEVEESEFENEVIEAFEDYEFEGETEVIVTEDTGKNQYQAYINTENAPIIIIEVNKDNEMVIVTNAYIA